MTVATAINPNLAPTRPGVAQTGERGSTSVVVPDDTADRIVVVYTTSDSGTISASPSASAPIEAQANGTGAQGIAVALVDGSAGDVTFSWPNATNSGGYATFAPYLPDGVADHGQVVEVDVALHSSGLNKSWPSVTPTKPGQTVLCLFGYHDNSGAPGSEAYLDASTYADATYFVGGTVFTTLTGSDASLGYHYFTDVPVDVAFAPQLTTFSSQAIALVTVLLDPAEETVPRLLGGDATFWNGVQTGDWPMPTVAEVAATGAKTGDLFCLYNQPYLGRYTTFGNADWLDGQYGGNGNATDSDGSIGWVRLGDDWETDLAGWIADPPTFSYQSSSPTSWQGWIVARGVVQTGAYAGTATGDTRGGNSSSWVDIPIDVTEDEFVIAFLGANISNFNFTNLDPERFNEQVPGSFGGLGVHPADTFVGGSPATGITATWSSNRNPYVTAVPFTAAALTNYVVDADITADATIAAVLTSQPGAQFIDAAITAGAVVDLDLTAAASRKRKPRRVHVWAADLAGVRRGVIT